MAGPCILVVDDQPINVQLLKRKLEREGIRITAAYTGLEALECVLKEKPDLILLDVMMPRLDGFAVCAELRKIHSHVPILFLTAKGMVQDRVKGLDAGADDYLVKPFSTEELLARVRALLRRTRREQQPLRHLQLGEVKIDFAAQTFLRDGQPVHCTPKEIAVLRLLAENAGEPVTRERFLDVVWGYGAFPTTRTVDNHIAMLRTKIDTDPENPRFIQTVHGVGYKLANFAIP